MGATRRSLGLGALATLVAAPAMARDEPLMRRPQSYQARRYATVVRQVLEYSCGSAALATVATYFIGAPTTEADVIRILRERHPTEEAWRQKQEVGFSFEDLIFAADRLGLAAQGGRIEVAQLPRIAGPVIVHLNKGTWQHFSVLRAARGGFFYLSDPINGQVTMSQEEFAGEFTGAVLAVWRRGVGLASRSPLQAVRDGVSVERTVSRAIELTIPHVPIQPPF